MSSGYPLQERDIDTEYLQKYKSLQNIDYYTNELCLIVSPTVFAAYTPRTSTNSINHLAIVNEPLNNLIDASLRARRSLRYKNQTCRLRGVRINIPPLGPFRMCLVIIEKDSFLEKSVSFLEKEIC